MKTIFLITVLMFSTQALANDHYWPLEHHTPHHKMYHNMHVKPHHEHEHHYKNHSSSHLHGDSGTSSSHNQSDYD